MGVLEDLQKMGLVAPKMVVTEFEISENDNTVLAETALANIKEALEEEKATLTELRTEALEDLRAIQKSAQYVVDNLGVRIKELEKLLT